LPPGEEDLPQPAANARTTEANAVTPTARSISRKRERNTATISVAIGDATPSPARPRAATLSSFQILGASSIRYPAVHAAGRDRVGKIIQDSATPAGHDSI
jgi:hypothetical protein